jgi:hypothetical protein
VERANLFGVGSYPMKWLHAKANIFIIQEMRYVDFKIAIENALRRNPTN